MRKIQDVCEGLQNGYLVFTEALNQLVGILLSTIHDQGNSNGEAANDLLVLRFLSVLDLRERKKTKKSGKKEGGYCWKGRTISSMALVEAVPSITSPMAKPAASPAMAESENKTALSSSKISSSSEAIAATPKPRQAPCCTVSFVARKRRPGYYYFFCCCSREGGRIILLPFREANRLGTTSLPWLAWIRPSAYKAPPSEKGLPFTPGWGR